MDDDTVDAAIKRALDEHFPLLRGAGVIWTPSPRDRAIFRAGMAHGAVDAIAAPAAGEAPCR